MAESSSEKPLPLPISKPDKKPPAGNVEEVANGSMRKLLLSNFTLKSLFSLASYPNPNQNEAREVIMEVSGSSSQHSSSQHSGTGARSATCSSVDSNSHSEEVDSGGVRLGFREFSMSSEPDAEGDAGAEGDRAKTPLKEDDNLLPTDCFKALLLTRTDSEIEIEAGTLRNLSPSRTPDRTLARSCPGLRSLSALDIHDGKSYGPNYDGGIDKDLDPGGSAKKASPASVSSLRPTAEEFTTKCSGGLGGNVRKPEYFFMGMSNVALNGQAQSASCSDRLQQQPEQQQQQQQQQQLHLFCFPPFASHSHSPDSDEGQSIDTCARSRASSTSCSTAVFTNHESRCDRRQNRKSALKGIFRGNSTSTSAGTGTGTGTGADTDTDADLEDVTEQLNFPPSNRSASASASSSILESLGKMLASMPPAGERTWSQHTEACHIEKQMEDLRESIRMPRQPRVASKQTMASTGLDTLSISGGSTNKLRFRHVSDMGQPLTATRVPSSEAQPRHSLPTQSASDVGSFYYNGRSNMAISAPARNQGIPSLLSATTHNLGVENITYRPLSPAAVADGSEPVAPTPMAAHTAKFLADPSGGSALQTLPPFLGQPPSSGITSTSSIATVGAAISSRSYPGVHPTGTHTAPPTITRPQQLQPSGYIQPYRGEQLAQAHQRPRYPHSHSENRSQLVGGVGSIVGGGGTSGNGYFGIPPGFQPHHPMGNLNAQTTQAKPHQLSPQHGDSQHSVTGYQSLVSAQSRTVQQQQQQQQLSSYAQAQPRPQIRHYYPHATPESPDDYCIYCSFEEYSPKFRQLPAATDYDCNFGGQDSGQNQNLDRQDNSETRRYPPENKACSQLDTTYQPPQELIGRVQAQDPKPSSAFDAAAGQTETLVGFPTKFQVPIPDAPWPYGIGVNASQKMKDSLRAQAYPLYMNAADIQVLERQKQAEIETEAIAAPSTAEYPAPMRPVDMDMPNPNGLWKADDGSWETHQEGRPHSRRDHIGKQQPASASYRNSDQSHGHSYVLAGEFVDPVSILSTACMSDTTQINTCRVRDKAHDRQQSQPVLPQFDGETDGLPCKSPHGVIGQHLDDLHDGYGYPDDPAASPAQLSFEAVLETMQITGGIEVEVRAGAGAVYSISNTNAPIRIYSGQVIEELLVGSTRDGN